jgi:type II secretory pathway predicted ATPase ExeA
LTNAGATGDEILQMILLGTKEMEARVAATTFKYFEDESTCQLYLEPITLKDTADYLRFCLQRAAAGNGNAP